MVKWAIHIIQPIIKNLTLGTGPGNMILTLEDEDGICCEDLTATNGTSGASQFVR